MASQIIRNLDVAVKERRRLRAAGHRGSMEEEVRVLLRDAVAATRDVSGSAGCGVEVAEPWELGGPASRQPQASRTVFPVIL